MNKIELLTKDKDAELTAFLNELSQIDVSVLGYHYPFYRDVLVQTKIGNPHYLALRKNNNIVAVLPGFVKSGKIGKAYSSMPFFGPNAGVLCNAENRKEYTQQIINYLLSFLNSEEFISASIYTPFLTKTELYAEILGPHFPMNVDKFTNYIKMEDLSISSKIRYDIRKAEKAGVKISSEITIEKVDSLYELYHQNCIDFNIPLKPRSCINALVNEAQKHRQTTFYFAELDGEVIGGLIMIWSPSVASYYLPCAMNEYRTLQPNTLLINHALKEAIERGIKIWNWESSPSKDSGVYKFKKKWGTMDGGYKIYVKPFRERQFYTNLGQKNIMREFPYYFIYPFNELNSIV